MNVTVFGATGQIGRLVVGDLLAGGHDVTAYVRNPAKLGHSDPRLVTVIGELSDEARIRQAVRGSDAVISALGPLLRRGCNQQLTAAKAQALRIASASTPGASSMT
jgi:uncharacterized protein YbjT (DUF2867 family)